MNPKRTFAGALSLASLALLLVACAPPSASLQEPCPTQEPQECPTPIPVETVECAPACPAPSELVSAAEAVVEAYIDSWEQRDVEKFFAVHTDDALIVDQCEDEEYFMDLSKSFYKTTFDNEAFRVTVDWYFISDDGRFALLEGMTTDYIKDGEPVMIPNATILEIEDGKIIKRTMYSHASSC